MTTQSESSTDKATYLAARSFLGIHMNPALPLIADPQACCIESHYYEFLELDHCKLSYREKFNRIHSDGKPNELGIYNISISLELLPVNGVSAGRSRVSTGYNEIAFHDFSGKAFEIFETSSGQPIRQYGQHFVVIENAIDSEQEEFVKNMRQLAKSCKVPDQGR